MVNGIGGAARTLDYYQRLQEVQANNLAQVNTAGFKALRVAAHAAPTGGATAPTQWTDWRQGALRETGRTLDVALDGPGFLVVDTARGERLIRGGSLRLDSDGFLTDLAGHPVLDQGGPVALFGSKIEIQRDGTLVVDGENTGRLRLETVGDLASLRREDDGMFVPQERPVAVPDGTTRILQGQVEDSNVDTLLTMVDMLSIQRSYAANVQSLKTIDQALRIAASQVGDV